MRVGHKTNPITNHHYCHHHPRGWDLGFSFCIIYLSYGMVTKARSDTENRQRSFQYCVIREQQILVPLLEQLVDRNVSFLSVIVLNNFQQYPYHILFKESMGTQVQIPHKYYLLLFCPTWLRAKMPNRLAKPIGHFTSTVWLVMTLCGQLYRKGGMSQQSEEFTLLFHRKRSCLARADKGWNYGESDYSHSQILPLGRKNQVTLTTFNKYNWTSIKHWKWSGQTQFKCVYLAN